MSLPLPNLTIPLASLGASLAVSRKGIQGTSQLAHKTTQAFGDLLSQINPLQDNGLSEATSPNQDRQLVTNGELPETTSSSDAANSFQSRLESLRNRLQKWLTETGEKLGANFKSDSISIQLDPDQNIVVDGPEPLRSELLNHLHSDKSLVDDLKQLQTDQPSPLQWLPPMAANPLSTGEPTKFDSLKIVL